MLPGGKAGGDGGGGGGGGGAPGSTLNLTLFCFICSNASLLSTVPL